MAAFQNSSELPDAESPNLHLTHPTTKERSATWKLNAVSWKGALTVEQYLERENHLLSAPLARNEGITHWILVDKTLPPDDRPLLASCETLRKRALISTDNHEVKDVISHGIGSVFCNPTYRGRRYAGRMMRELGAKLRTWQQDSMSCAFSVLWSDIGKLYYAGHGWQAFPSTHIELPPCKFARPASAKTLTAPDLAELCSADESMIRSGLASVTDGKTYVALVPDHETMQWHHRREEFLCEKLFGRRPVIKGAIFGEKGHRIWAIWTRSYYGAIDDPSSGNTLHILRLVIEDEHGAGSVLSNGHTQDYDKARQSSQRDALEAVLQAAQNEAAEWKSLHVEVWNPTALVQDLIGRAELKHSRVERESESIPALFWYGQGGGKVEDLEWMGNEKFGWC